MQEVGRIKAELTLTAVNHIDGTVFFSSTIPLTGSAVGGKKSAMKAMATGIKPSDPVYVRFIRKSREKVYTLSLHDALPIWQNPAARSAACRQRTPRRSRGMPWLRAGGSGLGKLRARWKLLLDISLKLWLAEIRLMAYLYENEESKKLFLIVGISNRCSSRRLFLP